MSAPVPAGWAPLTSGPFADRMGPILREDLPKSAPRKAPGAGRRYALAVGQGHMNIQGALHGGAAATLLDQAMAVEAWALAERRPVVTVQMELRYLAPVPDGALLVATVRLVRRAGSMLFMEATAEAGGEAVLAASAVMKIARGKTGAREGEG